LKLKAYSAFNFHNIFIKAKLCLFGIFKLLRMNNKEFYYFLPYFTFNFLGKSTDFSVRFFLLLKIKFEGRVSYTFNNLVLTFVDRSPFQPQCTHRLLREEL
jgi:hypothetical protein